VARRLLQGNHGGYHLNEIRISTSFKSIVVAVALAITTGCTRSQNLSPVTAANLVTAADVAADKTVGEGKDRYRILGREAVEKGLAAGSILSATSLKAKAKLKALAEDVAPAELAATIATPNEETSSPLLLGFPVELLGEYQVFGGVITAVSDAANESLGQLKLTDLPMLHVKPLLVQASESEYVLALMGCANACSESSPLSPLIVLKVTGVDEAKNTIIVDLAPLGSELNLVAMLDPEGEFTHLTTKTSKTVAFDYSLSTLVFDVETVMVPFSEIDEDEEEIEPADERTASVGDIAQPSTAKETTFKVRWYLRLGSTFNPAFESRPATPGVGYFMTDRSMTSKITRFSRSVFGGLSAVAGPVKYYIKNVPTEYQAGFKAAFDSWNETFVKNTGAPIFSYEFIAKDDPRSALLVPGDIRYNIVEWDLVNKAPYGGLGPSIANQFTGELLSANVLIQGPTVVDIYTKWFNATTRAEELRNLGEDEEAEKLLASTLRDIRATSEATKITKPMSLTLGKHLAFRVVSQIPSLSDPLFDERMDFEETPAGISYAAYMEGYFTEMVTHELGHNLGLRHNFRGNLSDTGKLELGKVSHSIMEYLGRGFRHINRIAEYDVMAIKYGYAGTPPNKLNLFCTDEDVASADNLAGSPECSRDDATADPYGYFEKRLVKSVSLLLEPGKKTVPVWSVKDMDRELSSAVGGLALYAARAELSGNSWTNFFTSADRPTDVKLIKAYTLGKVKSQLCNEGLDAIVAAKESEEAKAKTLANVADLRAKVKELLTPLELAEAPELNCQL